MFGNKVEKIASLVEKGKEGALIKLAGDKDKEVKIAALKGLGKIGKDDAFNMMIPLLTDSDADVREATAAALGVMGNSHANAHLRYYLESETNDKVKAAMKKAIESLGSQ